MQIGRWKAVLALKGVQFYVSLWPFVAPVQNLGERINN